MNYENNNALLNFADLVRRVRAAQKTFFKNRTNENLKRAISLEKQLDDILKDIPETKTFFEQINIFK